ncbi:unnamed protein product [Mycena citricolor]|uniref:GST N-terminal domain-containing protein n=1 Tax=Mycena citricolor TaxID=2018698 RepID=A0AAD2Q7E7_9AGAR|nr:unnamed protein product [Mycena citricolor]
MTEPILFFDIPSSVPGVAWSPNTWIIRYALNYKGLPYKTVWIEYPDIADHCLRIGAEPSMIRKNGKPYYSLPTIQDPNTGAVVSDSFRIAVYLDATYADTPRLIPQGTRTLQKTFRFAFDKMTEPVVPLILPGVPDILFPRSREYFRRTRAESFGKPLEELVPEGEARDAAWQSLQENYGKFAEWLDEESAGPYVMGDQLSFGDLVVAGELKWYMIGWGKESEFWKDLKTWHAGRWIKLLESVAQYEGPVESPVS